MGDQESAHPCDAEPSPELVAKKPCTCTHEEAKEKGDAAIPNLKRGESGAGSWFLIRYLSPKAKGADFGVEAAKVLGVYWWGQKGDGEHDNNGDSHN